MKTAPLDNTRTIGFPSTEAKSRLQRELQQIANESSVLRPEWEPLLDSKRIVGTVLALENLFPFKVAPDRVVRKGGYNSVDEAITDMLNRLERMWDQHAKRKERK